MPRGRRHKGVRSVLQRLFEPKLYFSALDTPQSARFHSAASRRAVSFGEVLNDVRVARFVRMFDVQKGLLVGLRVERILRKCFRRAVRRYTTVLHNAFSIVVIRRRSIP